MKKFFSQLDINKKLGLFAFALGFIAIFGANPLNHTYRTVNTKEIALETELKSGMIESIELADWLIKDKADFQLVDLRSPKEYNEYHIPGAVNLTIAGLNETGLSRAEKLLLYSENDATASQAWFLLKAKDYKAVYMLKGGLESWKENILFPKLALNASAEEIAAFEKTKQVSFHFGGQPQTGIKGDSLRARIEMPKLQAPAASAKGSAPRKKKEGC